MFDVTEAGSQHVDEVGSEVSVAILAQAILVQAILAQAVLAQGVSAWAE